MEEVEGKNLDNEEEDKIRKIMEYKKRKVEHVKMRETKHEEWKQRGRFEEFRVVEKITITGEHSTTHYRSKWPKYH